MAILKYGHAVVVNKMVCPGKWIDTVVPKGRIKVAKNVIAKFDPSKWLLTHVTIMASVDVEKRDKDPKKNYLIKPEYSIFVNNNGDCWERELLRAASKSFIGADNFLEHVQIKELSKGKVIDVALREVPFDKDNYGNDLTTLYVDVLIATSRKHTDLIEKIESGEYSAVSMGCVIKYGICSQCGNVAEDESKACKHIRYFKNNYFYDKDGVKRIVAELCGSSDDPESCKFIDASWVRKPAFEGAVLNKVIPFNVNISDKIQKAVQVPSFDYFPGMYLKAASKSIESQEEKEVAEVVPEEVPKDDIAFPEAPEEAEKPLEVEEETKAVENIPTKTVGMPDSPKDTLEKEVSPFKVEEPDEDATITEVMNLLEKNILNKIRRKILEEQAKELGEDSERPVELETKSNDNIVKKASLEKILSFALPNKRLYNGLIILSNLNDWNEFKDYGYSRDDLIGILYFVDSLLSSNPLNKDIVLAISAIKEKDKILFLSKLIVEIGRMPSVEESKKILSWFNILCNF